MHKLAICLNHYTYGCFLTKAHTKKCYFICYV